MTEASINEELFPATEEDALPSGVRVVIRKTKTKDFASVVTFVAQVLRDLREISGNNMLDFSNYAEVLQLIADHSERLFPIVALHCNLTVAEIEDLDVADSAVLVSLIVEKNKRFFVERVLPAIQRAQA